MGAHEFSFTAIDGKPISAEDGMEPLRGAPGSRIVLTIVRDGTRPTQTVVACSLRRLVERAPAYDPHPGLLIIGETVRLSPEFHAE